MSVQGHCYLEIRRGKLVEAYMHKLVGCGTQLPQQGNNMST